MKDGIKIPPKHFTILTIHLIFTGSAVNQIRTSATADDTPPVYQTLKIQHSDTFVCTTNLRFKGWCIPILQI